MEKLRQLAVTEIRANQQLETDLDQMDIKIGLLVKNRINIQVRHLCTGGTLCIDFLLTYKDLNSAHQGFYRRFK